MHEIVFENSQESSYKLNYFKHVRQEIAMLRDDVGDLSESLNSFMQSFVVVKNDIETIKKTCDKHHVEFHSLELKSTRGDITMEELSRRQDEYNATINRIEEMITDNKRLHELNSRRIDNLQWINQIKRWILGSGFVLVISLVGFFIAQDRQFTGLEIQVEHMKEQIKEIKDNLKIHDTRK